MWFDAGCRGNDHQIPRRRTLEENLHRQRPADLHGKRIRLRNELNRQSGWLQKPAVALTHEDHGLGVLGIALLGALLRLAMARAPIDRMLEPLFLEVFQKLLR